MNDLSTAASTDISSQIGALELGDHLESYGDGALEAMAGPTATQIGLSGCPPLLTQIGCTRYCVSDGALEASGASMNPGPTLPVGRCSLGPPTLRGLTCAGDDALEVAGTDMAQAPRTQMMALTICTS